MRSFIYIIICFLLTCSAIAKDTGKTPEEMDILELKRKLQALKKENEYLQKRNEGLKKIISIMKEKQAKRAQKELEPDEKKELKNLRGKVLKVNKKWKFIVIDLGKDKIASEHIFMDVVRGKQIIGQVEIIRINDNCSVCDIKSQAEEIKAGDQVMITVLEDEDKE